MSKHSLSKLPAEQVSKFLKLARAHSVTVEWLDAGPVKIPVVEEAVEERLRSVQMGALGER